LIAGYATALGLGIVLAAAVFWTPQATSLVRAAPWPATAVVLANCSPMRRLTYLLREIFGIQQYTDRLLQITDGGCRDAVHHFRPNTPFQPELFRWVAGSPAHILCRSQTADQGVGGGQNRGIHDAIAG
jgi:hypothetical protein